MTTPPRTAPGDAGEKRRSQWIWLAPRVSIALLVAAFLGLLWMKQREESDEAHRALVRDLLWVEQTIRFNLGREVDQLEQLDLARGSHQVDQASLETLVSHLLPSCPGLTQVVVLDERGVVVAGAPLPVAAGTTWRFDGEEGDGREASFRLALATGEPAWGPAFRSGGDQRFEVFVPRSRGGQRSGVVVGVHGFGDILAGLVPWWLAERHLVTVRDAVGAVVAAKSNVAAGEEPALAQQVPLEPPGHGLVLHLASYPTAAPLLPRLITASLVALAAALLWNLWALRRHIQRRQATEQALRAEHAFRTAMEESLHTGMRAVDLTGRITYVNAAFCRMVGYEPQELVGQHGPARPYWPPEQAAGIDAALAAARAGGPSPTGLELRLMRRGGERFDALVFEAPLIDADGRQTGWMGSVLDITERKQARERARQQEERLAASARLVAMGEMASALAHELNQPLAAIAGYTTGGLNLLEGAPAGGPGAGPGGGAVPGGVAQALRKAAEQAQRAGQIIRRVHEFVRQREPARSAVRLNAMVDEAVGFAEPEAHQRGVRIAVAHAPGAPVLHADPLLLQQVLLNLLRNGMDAMEGTPPEARQLEVGVACAGATATVTVADRGCGLAEAVRERMFQPFFTTKAGGMGLGLHICRSVMETHGGRIWAEPNPVGGTVFAFSLPRGEA